ncbi:hypothetical protein HII17_14305 [Thalassotalea sp. M1531]|uniref:Lipoprotein n=1 Tax=Thalassotalea algicola TaxID=2716224 RepID=A0A7Y0LFG4_9GAMM|nr:hypothetical protein [Thalassotalea algicola]NMP32731.1 hypothetical protein [Thalassotalea algicola]
MFKNYHGLGKLMFVFAFITTLAACGSTPNNYLPQAATNEINSTDIYVVLPQKEIVAEIDRSSVAAAGGGGLLLALIDVAVENSRASTAEELIQPIKDSLIETSFNKLFLDALNEEFDAVNWMKIRDVKLISDITETTVEDHYKGTDAQTVTFINTNYSLSPDFSSLKAYANLSMLPKSEELKKYSEKATSKKAKQYAWHNDNNIYRDSVIVSSKLNSTTTDKEENAKVLANNADELKAEFSNVARKLAKQVVSSMNTTEVAPN